jgi:hypothetical protein
MKRRDYYALGLAITITLLFGWLIAVTIQPSDFGVELARLVVFAAAVEKANATLR